MILFIWQSEAEKKIETQEDLDRKKKKEEKVFFFLLLYSLSHLHEYYLFLVVITLSMHTG